MGIDISETTFIRKAFVVDQERSRLSGRKDLSSQAAAS